MLSLGFLILSEADIEAGLQFHYLLSSLPGSGSEHRLSCSAGLLIRPSPDWELSLFSRHLLCFPCDSTENLLELLSGIGLSYRVLPQLKLTISAKKRLFFPWQVSFGVRFQTWHFLSCFGAYDLSLGKMDMGISLDPGKWSFQLHVGCHRYLGLTQELVIAYDL